MSYSCGIRDDVLSRLRGLEGYALPRMGVAPDRNLVGLDSNENFLADAESLQEISEEAARCDLRSYPREELIELRDMLGAWLKVPQESILLGNGGDQLIDILLAMLARNEAAVTTLPTYSLYRFRVDVAGGKLIQVPLRNDFTFDPEGLVSTARLYRASIILLCCPNNPTGNRFPEADVENVLRSYPGMVVLDEAYVEFAGRSLVQLTQKHSNLAVIRTFSKAFGVAGARIGYMVANQETCRIFEKIQVPYSVSKFAARLGTKCLRRLDSMQESVSKLVQERGWLTHSLRMIDGLRVFDSEANFVLVCTGRDSTEFCERLRSLGVSVRNIGDVLDFRGCVRITVGTRPMNEKLLSAIRKVMNDERR